METVGLTLEGLSSGVMCSLSLEAPLWMALPVYSAPFTRPQLNQDAPERTLVNYAALATGASKISLDLY